MIDVENPDGLIVQLLVSDPWEFGSECGVGPFDGVVTDLTQDALVIQLGRPIIFDKRLLRAALAKPRHIGVGTDLVRTPAGLAVNLLLLARKVRTVAEITPDVTVDAVAAIGYVGPISVANS